MEKLSPEVLEQILLKVPYPSLTQACQMNTLAAQICAPSNNYFWKHKAIHDFGTSLQRSPGLSFWDISYHKYTSRRPDGTDYIRYFAISLETSGKARYLQFYDIFQEEFMISAMQQGASLEEVMSYYRNHTNPSHAAVWALYLGRFDVYKTLISELTDPITAAVIALIAVLDDKDVAKLQEMMNHPPDASTGCVSASPARHTTVPKAIEVYSGQITPLFYDLMKEKVPSQYKFVQALLNDLMDNASYKFNEELFRHMVARERLVKSDLYNNPYWGRLGYHRQQEILEMVPDKLSIYENVDYPESSDL